MEHTNLDKLTAILSEWLRPAITEVAKLKLGTAPAITAANAWIVKYFPVNSGYSILNDLGFLVVPTMQAYLRQILQGYMQKLNVSDIDLPYFMDNVINSMQNEITNNGKLSLFGMLELNREDLDSLKVLLEKNMFTSNMVNYTVIK